MKVDDDTEYMDAVIFNKNRLCAVDIRTTGPYVGVHDIVQICIYPLTSRYELAKNIIPFNINIRPLRDTKDPHYLKSDQYANILQFSVPPNVASDLLEKWCREKLELSEKKKIIPLTHDWAFQRPFLIDWLGEKTFEYLFSKEYRDLLSVILFANDWAETNVEQVPFPKVHLNYAARQVKILFNRLDDCIIRCKGIANLYRHILGNTQGMYM